MVLVERGLCNTNAMKNAMHIHRSRLFFKDLKRCFIWQPYMFGFIPWVSVFRSRGIATGGRPQQICRRLCEW